MVVSSFTAGLSQVFGDGIYIARRVNGPLESTAWSLVRNWLSMLQPGGDAHLARGQAIIITRSSIRTSRAGSILHPTTTLSPCLLTPKESRGPFLSLSGGVAVTAFTV